ncbi:MAG TPA: Ig-like domain-containing protein [Pseudonocardiaceae bacterium]|nr:Ig-like domain-containing protein [Pseudonocardiaceae bacterium]
MVADARVTTDHNGAPVGTVQFKDGSTNIGPPVAVIAGNAFLIAFRPPGSHLTAMFIPRPGSHFTSSTSNTVTVRS